MRKGRRYLCVLLTLLMCLSMLPAVALAEESAETAEPIEAVEPVEAEPIEAEPVEEEPVEEEPAEAEHVEEEPAEEEPVEEEPAEEEPAEAEPVEEEPAGEEPAEEEPAEAEPAEEEPAGVEPIEAEGPVEAEPIEAEPVEGEEPAEEEAPIEGEVPVEAEIEELVLDGVSSTDWSLKTIDGGTVTQKTYKDKVQLLIFYDGVMIDGSAEDSYSKALIASIAKAWWLDNEKIQVVAIESRKDDITAAMVKDFKKAASDDSGRIVYALGGRMLMWSIVNEYGVELPVHYAFCAIVKDGKVVDTWDLSTTALECEQHLSGVMDLNANPGLTQISVTGTYHQTEARAMLDMINEFRTGADAWYWNSDNTKTQFNTGGNAGLGAYTYDYALEQIAMQRAAELAVKFEHERPNGESCFTVTYNGFQSYGENLARGSSAEQVFNAWQETDKDYAGQSHRRFMLSSSFTTVGFACFEYNGSKYWVQEFGYKQTGTAETPAKNDTATIVMDYLGGDPTPKPPVTENPFTDVSESASYYSKIMWAYENGIVKGTSATTFSPKDNCTRGQFALMLYRLAGKPDVSGINNPFKDVKKSDPYYKAILWAYNQGIIKGTSATAFSPNDSVTRGQIVLMLYRMAGKPEVTGTNSFTDLKKSDSCYKGVLWAISMGITYGVGDGTRFAPNDPCTRYQLVTFLYRFNQFMGLI